METFARVQDGLVMEVLKTDQPVTGRFHPDLVWVQVPNEDPVSAGWHYDTKNFLPPHETPHVVVTPSLHDIMAALAGLQEQLAFIKGTNS